MSEGREVEFKLIGAPGGGQLNLVVGLKDGGIGDVDLDAKRQLVKVVILDADGGFIEIQRLDLDQLFIAGGIKYGEQISVEVYGLTVGTAGAEGERAVHILAVVNDPRVVVLNHSRLVFDVVRHLIYGIYGEGE